MQDTPNEQQVEQTTDDSNKEPRMILGDLILRILWIAVIFWWMIKSC